MYEDTETRRGENKREDIQCEEEEKEEETRRRRRRRMYEVRWCLR